MEKESFVNVVNRRFNMKTIKCDFCGEEIKLKEGELFNLEIRKITEDIENYPSDYSADYIYNKDLCKKCLNRIEFLIGLKKIKPKSKRNKKVGTTQRGKIVTTKKKCYK